MISKRIVVPFLLVLTLGLAACDKATVSAPAPAAPETKVAEPRDPNRLWCNEHGVYEDECVICHPEIAAKKVSTERDPIRLWCNEHGLYEDECVICHPEIAAKKASTERDPNRLWCNEHSLYEDECVICHPELKDKVKAIETPTADAGLMCKEHGVLEAECGICHPDLLADLPPGQGLKVRFGSGESAAKAGISTGTPAAPATDAPRELTGRIVFNQNTLASVVPPVAGIVVEVKKDVGDSVEAGEILAVVRAADVAKARSEYAKALAESKLARQTYDREKNLHERKISARRDMEEAQAAVAVAQSAAEEARQQLLALGLTEAQLKNGDDAGSLLSIRAPLAGTVIERAAVQGTTVEPGTALFQVADLSSVWMQLSVPETRLASLKTGAPVRARFDAYPGISFEGQIEWIAPRLNPDTRMLEARAAFPNPQGLLKDGLFGHASLGGPAAGGGLTVPASAVQDVDGMPVVFRKLEEDLYETRRVELGAVEDGQVVVLAGLAPGEQLVTEGSYIMKSELLKARLGAGCTDH